MLLNTHGKLAILGRFGSQRVRSGGAVGAKTYPQQRLKTYAPKVWKGSESVLHLQAKQIIDITINNDTKKLGNPMNMIDLRDFPTLLGERLSSIICEDVADYLREVKEYITKINKELRETQEERDDLRREVEELHAKKQAVEADALRSMRAIPVDFIERFAKGCTTWPEAQPLYEMLLDYADGDREIKQKARNIKAHHTRLKNTHSKQVYIQSKQTNINNPTFGSMYDIHDNDEVKAG